MTVEQITTGYLIRFADGTVRWAATEAHRDAIIREHAENGGRL